MALSLITSHSWLPIIFTLISRANGNGWTINVTRHTEASFGSNAFIRCQFTHPHGPGLRDVTVFWKKEEFNDRGKGDLNPFIFHHDSSQVRKAYRGRTALTGNVQNGDCSLSIQNVTNDESRLYVRVRAVKFFSFYNYLVSIKVTEIAAKEVVITTSSQTSTSSKIMYPSENTPILATSQTPASSSTPVIYVVVPMAALFIVAILASVGFLVHRKYSRVQSLDRSSSGFYLNFTRTSTNPNNGALSALTRCPPQHEGLKVIDDEPVYSNVQPQSHPPSCWTADVDESIYANV